jgi:hypothetical protein
VSKKLAKELAGLLRAMLVFRIVLGISRLLHVTKQRPLSSQPFLINSALTLLSDVRKTEVLPNDIYII